MAGERENYDIDPSKELNVMEAFKRLTLTQVKGLAEDIKVGRYSEISFYSFDDNGQNIPDDLEKKLESVCSAIEQANPKIKSISFPSRPQNTFGHDRIYAMCRNGRFEELRASGLAYGDKGAFMSFKPSPKNQNLLLDERLPLEAAKNPNIKRLRVTFVNQDSKGRDHIAGLDYFLKNHSGIESLYISQTSRGFEEAAMAVIAPNTTIKQFEIAEGILTDVAAQKLADFITNNPNLQEIKFGCGMSDAGWKIIAAALGERPEILVEGHQEANVNTDHEMSPRAVQIAALTKKLAIEDLSALQDNEISELLEDMGAVIWASQGRSIISSNQVMPSAELDSKISELLTLARFRGLDIPDEIKERYRDKLMGTALVPERTREIAKKDPLEGIEMDAQTRAFVEDAQKNGLDLGKALWEVSVVALCKAISAGAFTKVNFNSFPNYIYELNKVRSDDHIFVSSGLVEALRPFEEDAELLVQALAASKYPIDEIKMPASFKPRESQNAYFWLKHLTQIVERANARHITIPCIQTHNSPLYFLASTNPNVESVSIDSVSSTQAEQMDAFLLNSERIKQLAIKLDGDSNSSPILGELPQRKFKTLNVSGGDLSKKSSDALVEFLLRNDELEELSLSDCHMSDAQWAQITEALKQRPLILVKGHPDPSFNTAEMTVHRQRLLEVGTAIATREVADLDDAMIRDAIGSLTIIERALNAKSVLEIPAEHLPVNTDAKIAAILSEARIRGIEIPQDVQEKHRDKLMGSSLVAPRGHTVKVGVLETMLRADKSIDMEVGLHNSLVASIAAGIEAIIAREKGAKGELDAAGAALKQARRDNAFIEWRMDVEGVHMDASSAKLVALNEADERLSRHTAFTEQLVRFATKATWETGKAIATGQLKKVPEGIGNALSDMAAHYIGDEMRIADRREMREIGSSIEHSAREEIIEIMRSQLIDTAKYEREIDALAAELEQLAKSKEVEAIRKDEAKQERIASGLLRQRLVKSGLDVCVELEKHYLIPNNIESIDTFVAALSDDRLEVALSNLCYGRADSNDMEVLIAEANGLKGSNLKPHEKALKGFVEQYVKADIDGFMTKASFVDAIRELNLVNLDTLGFSGQVDKKAPKPNAKGELLLSDDDKISTKSRIALMSTFADEYGQRHIGNYYIQRLFRFWLTRHGDTTLVADEVLDGNRVVYKDYVGKEVSLLPEREMRQFAETVKRGGSIKQDDMPTPDDLFLRVCGYEYYLPQAVRTGNDRNKLSENPEAPIAYPMVNKVIGEFVKRMVDGGLDDYRGKVGARLDNVVAQSFIDFFAAIGRRHREQFAPDREALRTGYGHDLYTRKFTPHMNRITESALAEYDTFLDIYARNLEKYMQVVPESEQAELRAQVEAVKDLADGKLNPPILEPGSHADRERARRDDHSFANITENFGRSGKRA